MADVTITRQRPIPLNADGTAKYTARQWIAECCAEYVERIARAGLEQIAKDAVSDDVTVTR